MMQSSGEFRRYADEQEAVNTVAQRKVQRALRDAAARIDELEKRCLELDAACCDYQRQRDEVQDERRHAVAALSEQVDAARDERDRARRLVCELQCDPPQRFIGLPHEVAQMYGWDCFPEPTP
jgi:predicted transcriptional regulator